MANSVSAAGYVVQSFGVDRFLSRTMRFVRHRDRKLARGIQRAWAHNESVLLAGGGWIVNAYKIYPVFRRNGYNKIIGDPMTYNEFLVTHSRRVEATV
jgi:hypothetical protein